MTFKVRFLSLAAVVALGQPSLLMENAWASELTTTELVSLIRDAKIVSASSRLTTAISGKEVSVMTKRAAKLTDDDCKINAVLMAKTVMNAYPAINRVKVLYAVEGSDSCDRVVVRTGDVKSFDAGAVSEEQLLSSLELQRVSSDQLTGASEGSSQVAAGPFRERRLLLLSRIEDLKQNGTGVGPFMQSFKQIEEMVASNNTKDTQTALDNLARNLTEQEKLRRQAQKVSAGQGVRGASLQRPNTPPSKSSTAFAPAGSGGMTASAAPLTDAEKQFLLNGLARTHDHLNFMRNKGIDVADFENRIRSVESSVHKNAGCAKQELNELQMSMNQRCQGKGIK